MALPALEIVQGEVAEVQLTSEKIESDPGRVRRPVQAVISKMRVFLRCEDAKERDFDFEDAEIGVRAGHQIVVVRGRGPKMERAVNLMLVNASNAEREEYEQGFLALYRPPFFGPRWRALGLSAIMLVIGIGLSQWVISPGSSLARSFWWALFFAFLAYPVFWGIMALWARMDRKARLARHREAIRRAVAGRLKAELPRLHVRD
ncbi:MAG: hypothetical protein AB7O04_05045 [Hyphomonadaceae bacterium]